jgi:hypothetical protein
MRLILSGIGDHKTPRAGTTQADADRKQSNNFRMASDPINRMYAKASWKHFRLVMLGRNPICQRLIKNQNGELEQCHAAASVVHHRVSPRADASLFLVPKNTICFCELHHPAGVEGDPKGFTEGVDFVATVVPSWHV